MFTVFNYSLLTERFFFFFFSVWKLFQGTRVLKISVEIAERCLRNITPWGNFLFLSNCKQTRYENRSLFENKFFFEEIPLPMANKRACD